MKSGILDVIEVKAYVEGALSCVCGNTSEVLVPVTLQGDLDTGEVSLKECGDPIYCPVCERKHRAWESLVIVNKWHRFRFELEEGFYTAAQVLNSAAQQRGLGSREFRSGPRRRRQPLDLQGHADDRPGGLPTEREPEL